MSAEPISMQEWLQHANPATPLAVLHNEARKLAEQELTCWELLEQVREEADWMRQHFEDTNERHQFAADEDEWGDAA